MKYPLLLAFAIALGVSPCAAAQTAKPDAASIAKRGNGHGAPACATCHGANGMGQAAAGFPRLAGLNAAYLQRQLDDMATGERNAAVMKPIVASLSEDERAALAEYYSKLPLTTSAAAPAVAASVGIVGNTRGAWLATRGEWTKQVPGCVACPGPRGVGVGAHFPPLAGQPAKYIADQLRAFKDGGRHNDPLGLMQHVASALTDQDIDAVSAWFAAQPLKPAGDKP